MRTDVEQSGQSGNLVVAESGDGFEDIVAGFKVGGRVGLVIDHCLDLTKGSAQSL